MIVSNIGMSVREHRHHHQHHHHQQQHEQQQQQKGETRVHSSARKSTKSHLSDALLQVAQTVVLSFSNQRL
jgi:hypothetical protein